MVTKGELVSGYRKLKDEVELSRANWGTGNFSILEDALKGAINRHYGNGFIALSDSEVMRTEVEAAYRTFLGDSVIMPASDAAAYQALLRKRNDGT